MSYIYFFSKYLYIRDMIEIIQKYGPIIASSMTVGSLVFVSGRESNRLDEVIRKAHAAEVDRKSIQEIVFDMHGRICSIEKDIKYIKDKD